MPCRPLNNEGRRRGTPQRGSERNNPLEQTKQKFDLGRVVITPAATAALDVSRHTLADLLERHQTGDWGDVSHHENTVNERGLIEQFNLQSAYDIAEVGRLVVVTNGQRTLTMVHLDRPSS